MRMIMKNTLLKSIIESEFPDMRMIMKNTILKVHNRI